MLRGVPDPGAREAFFAVERFHKNQMIGYHNRTVGTKKKIRVQKLTRFKLQFYLCCYSRRLLEIQSCAFNFSLQHNIKFP